MYYPFFNKKYVTLYPSVVPFTNIAIIAREGFDFAGEQIISLGKCLPLDLINWMYSGTTARAS